MLFLTLIKLNTSWHRLAHLKISAGISLRIRVEPKGVIYHYACNLITPNTSHKKTVPYKYEYVEYQM